MKGIKKISLCLGITTLLSCLSMPALAELLVLNRINNQLDKPVTVTVENIKPNPKKFTIEVKPHENKTLPWSTVWLANTTVPSGNATEGLGNLLINGAKYAYGWWVGGGFGHIYQFYVDTLIQTFLVGVYPLQGRAWVYLDITKSARFGFVPYLHPER